MNHHELSASTEHPEAKTDANLNIRFPLPIAILIDAAIKTAAAVGFLLGIIAIDGSTQKVDAAVRDHAMWPKRD